MSRVVVDNDMSCCAAQQYRQENYRIVVLVWLLVDRIVVGVVVPIVGKVTSHRPDALWVTVSYAPP